MGFNFVRGWDQVYCCDCNSRYSVTQRERLSDHQSISTEARHAAREFPTLSWHACLISSRKVLIHAKSSRQSATSEQSLFSSIWNSFTEKSGSESYQHVLKEIVHLKNTNLALFTHCLVAPGTYFLKSNTQIRRYLAWCPCCSFQCNAGGWGLTLSRVIIVN